MGRFSQLCARKLSNSAADSANAAAKAKRCSRDSVPAPRPASRARADYWRHRYRLCHLIWKTLHLGIRHEQRGPAMSQSLKQIRAAKMIRELRSLDYPVELRYTLRRRERFSTLATVELGRLNTRGHGRPSSRETMAGLSGICRCGSTQGAGPFSDTPSLPAKALGTVLIAVWYRLSTIAPNSGKPTQSLSHTPERLRV